MSFSKKILTKRVEYGDTPLVGLNSMYNKKIGGVKMKSLKCVFALLVFLAGFVQFGNAQWFSPEVKSIATMELRNHCFTDSQNDPFLNHFGSVNVVRCLRAVDYALAALDSGVDRSPNCTMRNFFIDGCFENLLDMMAVVEGEDAREMSVVNGESPRNCRLPGIYRYPLITDNSTRSSRAYHARQACFASFQRRIERIFDL